MCPISCTRYQKAADNPKTLIKVNIHISGSVKTYKTSGQDMTRPSGGLPKDVQNSMLITKSVKF